MFKDLDPTPHLKPDPNPLLVYLHWFRATFEKKSKFWEVMCAGLSKYEDAMADYQKVLDLEPTNKAAKLEQDKLQEKCAAAAEKKLAELDAEEKKPAKLDLKTNISRMFAPSEGPREREARNNKVNRAESPTDPFLVLPVVKPPHLR